MKKREKSRNAMRDSFEMEGQRRTKLKPVKKQKYSHKNYFEEEDEGEIDLFNFDTDQ
jgi:hypothetical protein